MKSKKAEEGHEMSLITFGTVALGILILFVFGRGVMNFVGITEEFTDNSDKLSEMIRQVLVASTGDEASTRSYSLATRDLFYFFSYGREPIRMSYQGDGEYKDFIFTRPQECLDESCICHCNDGPYWDRVEEEPYLFSVKLLPGEEFTCQQMTCQTLGEEYTFVNSQERNLLYFDDRIPNDFYNPISMDIVGILHILSIPYDPGLLNTNTIRESLKRVSEEKNPFYKKSDDASIAYTFSEQSSHYYRALNGYRWEGGYVLGGYGVDEDEDPKKISPLVSPPIVLRLEGYDEGVIGICLHDLCLREDDRTSIQAQVRGEKLQRRTREFFNQFKKKLDSAPRCLDSLPAGSDTFLCSPFPELYSIYSQEGIFNLNPTMIFEVVEEEGKDPVTHINFSHIQEDFPILTTPTFFSCDLQTDIVIKLAGIPENLIEENLAISTYVLEDGSTCELSFHKSRPVATTQ